MNASRGTCPLIDPGRLPFWEIIARLYQTCPFDLAWEALEQAALCHGGFTGGPETLSSGGALTENLGRMSGSIGMELAVAAHALEQGATATEHELEVYRGVALYGLFERYGAQLQRLIDEDGVDVPFYDDFLETYRVLFRHRGLVVPEPALLLELFYQARRAWYFASTKILGRSPSARAARVAIWRANMGRNVCLYADGLYRTMPEVPVLITGETGTGKELAAECVAWSRYIPFDVEARRFVRRPREDYHTTNVCAAPNELVESALFGHKRGSFTGATADSVGFFGLSQAGGTLFLDEAGEIPLHVQAKLLRPCHNRVYTPIGESNPRPILGRLIFATHNDLEARCREGKFRADLLERMSGYHIHMPSLRQMLAEAPGELRTYVRAFVEQKKLDHPEQNETRTDMVVASIQANKTGYAWPRNLRQLQHHTERCLLDEDAPPAPAPATTAPASPRPATTPPPSSTPVPSVGGILGPRAKAGEVTLAEVVRAFLTWMYFLAGQNAAEAARRARINKKTLLRKIDFGLLARWLKRAK